LRYLRAKELLLVLDNCEHLVEACANLVRRLLAGCPSLHILATSREGLEVAGEALYPVLPLAYPEGPILPDVDLLKRYETVQLFVERAGLVRPAFRLTPENGPTIARICQRLDGIPLAIELALSGSAC
jgi:non-specific serine/threonine protein kinase